MSVQISTTGGTIRPGAVNVHVDASAARCRVVLVQGGGGADSELRLSMSIEQLDALRRQLARAADVLDAEKARR